MLPGAAPAEFRGLDGRWAAHLFCGCYSICARLKTPKLAKDSGRGPKREAQREKMQAQQAQQKAAQKRQEAMPTLDVAVQRRLEVVWDILQVLCCDCMLYLASHGLTPCIPVAGASNG